MSRTSPLLICMTLSPCDNLSLTQWYSVNDASLLLLISIAEEMSDANFNVNACKEAKTPPTIEHCIPLIHVYYGDPSR